MKNSFEPRNIAIGLQRTSFTHSIFEKGEVFTINIFNKSDAEASKPIIKSWAKNPNKVEVDVYTDGAETRCPILDEAAAYLECKIVEGVVIRGDHDIGWRCNRAAVNKPDDSADTLKLPNFGWSYAG